MTTLEDAVGDLAAHQPAPAVSPLGPTKPSRRPVIRQYELVERVRAYDPQVNEDLLNSAYVYAMQAHGAQLRASGDPYFHHPVEVAGILAGFRVDSASIATGLLHDTGEDTGATIDEMESLFGTEVAKLVDGVTKLNKLELRSTRTAQAENFRKLLLAMSEDIRVLLVKLADRLHNMRTLHFIRNPEKRQRIAIETLEIYAPLAERIGMDKMKAELEDLAFEELWPQPRATIIRRLNQLRVDDADLIDRIINGLSNVLRDAGIEAKVSGREKAPISIWRKMERKSINFEQLSDIMAFRVTVADIANCYAALGTIHGQFSMVPGRFKDFISTPKSNGYRSIHTTVQGPEKRRIEVQIRTEEMHEVAEFGVAAHWAYKQNQPVTDGRQYRWLRELLDIMDQAETPEEFLEHTKLAMFQDQVFCFTPKGDLIAMPKGATPIDFAYAVHSEIGDHLQGAKIHGRIVPLRTRLNNGDQVEVITSKTAKPSRTWLNYVVSGKARAKIRRALREQSRGEYIASGREQLARAARTRGVSVTDRQLEGLLEEFHQASVDDLLVNLTDGSISTRAVLEALHPTQKSKNGSDRSLRIIKADPIASEKDRTTPIRGLGSGVDFTFAGCCRPIPGDPIIGIVRTGRGVTIHRCDCYRLEPFHDQPERLLPVDWNPLAARAPARLVVVVEDQPGVLGHLSLTIGNNGGNIVDLKMRQRGVDAVEMVVDVEVEGSSQIDRIIAALVANDEVQKVSRANG
ncbi:MAG: RelA/SpoT family protein [Geminicoccaceae bacterium]